MSPKRLQGNMFRNNARVRTAESEFVHVTYNRYTAMVERFAERRNQLGHVTQVGREIPFSLAEFRVWVRAQLNNSVDGYTRCSYCNRVLDLSTMQVDHVIPGDRGGSLGFDNLCAACEPCNQQKGEMTGGSFMRLLKFLDDLPPADRSDVADRLQIAIRLAIDNRRLRAAKYRQGDAL